MSSIEIFFSYADKDKELLGELEKHLTFLKSERRVTGWHNRKIVAGQQWAREIETHLNTAQIILLLISPDFVASEYCYSGEMKRAMERHERGQAHVIPIILRPVHWQGAPFGKLQPLPTDAKPIISSNWHYPDEAFFNVAEGIIKVVEELMKKPSSWQQPQAAQFSHMLEEKDVSPIPSGREREALYQLADAYRKMRYDLHPGPERTSLMTSLVEQMRALAPLVTFSPDEMNRLLQSKKQEEERRLLGLALIRGSGDARYFGQVLQIIDDPYSAFEQWQALRAMEQMLPSLERRQKDHLRQILTKQRNYDETNKQWILPNSDRGWLSSKLLSIINSAL